MFRKLLLYLQLRYWNGNGIWKKHIPILERSTDLLFNAAVSMEVFMSELSSISIVACFITIQNNTAAVSCSDGRTAERVTKSLGATYCITNFNTKRFFLL